ncbi:MAG TPA: NUDIX domain-containing protein [Chitinophagaceae bacterium]|nr:NUDIX domain-containing protein [Chitinophagaceae bacterium]
MRQIKAALLQAEPFEKVYLSNLSIDCVVFGYHEKKLKILCTRIDGMSGWLLPGGFIKKAEDVDRAASRILEERTGVKDLYLNQFRVFGKPGRSWENREEIAELKTLTGAGLKQLKFITERFVSIGYYALTEYSKVTPKPGLWDSECEWFDIYELPPLLLDHNEIFREAFKTLQHRLHHEPIGLNLLTEKFTLPELQALYETILEKKLDQRNFTKKLVYLDLIRKLNEKKYIGGHRSPTLYKFNRKEYRNAVKQGMELAF